MQISDVTDTAAAALREVGGRLADLVTPTLRLGVTYDILRGGWRFVDKGSVSVFYDHIEFQYDDFRDLTGSGAVPGQEPLYSFGADVLQFFVSFWF